MIGVGYREVDERESPLDSGSWPLLGQFAGLEFSFGFEFEKL